VRGPADIDVSDVQVLLKRIAYRVNGAKGMVGVGGIAGGDAGVRRNGVDYCVDGSWELVASGWEGTTSESSVWAVGVVGVEGKAGGGGAAVAWHGWHGDSI